MRSTVLSLSLLLVGCGVGGYSVTYPKDCPGVVEKVEIPMFGHPLSGAGALEKHTIYRCKTGAKPQGGDPESAAIVDVLSLSAEHSDPAAVAAFRALSFDDKLAYLRRPGWFPTASLAALQVAVTAVFP